MRKRLALAIFSGFPTAALAQGRVDFGNVADFTAWLAGAMRRSGLPDIGVAYLNDADFVALIALFVFFALLISAVGVIVLREKSLSLRAGFYAAFGCGLAGALFYRVKQVHPSLGDEMHLYAWFLLGAVAGLALFDFAKSLRADRPVHHHDNSPLRARMERASIGAGKRRV